MTVKEFIVGVNLEEYTHLVIARRDFFQLTILGGGYVPEVVRRFGSCNVVNSRIRSDGIMFVIVK